MHGMRPLTSQEIDDGWCLDEVLTALPAQDDEPYLELVIGEVPSSALEEAFWEQREGKKLTRRFGETCPDFGKGLRVRGTLPPPADTGN